MSLLQNNDVELDYQKQATTFIGHILSKDIIKDDPLGAFATHSSNKPIDILEKTLREMQSIDVLFNNPILDFNKKVKSVDNFFKTNLLNHKTTNLDVLNLVSSKTFVDKVSNGVISSSVAELSMRKETEKLLVLFSSKQIIDRLEGGLLQNIFDEPLLDYTIMSRVLREEEALKEFAKYLGDMDTKKLENFVTGIKSKLVPATLKVIEENDDIKEKIVNIVDARLQKNSVIEELSKAKKGYVELFSNIPDVVEKLDITNNKGKLASLRVEELVSIINKLNGESFKLLFKEPFTSQDNAIFRDLIKKLSEKSRTDLDAWFKTTSNEAIELLMEANAIQDTFLNFVRKDLNKKAIQKLTAEYIKGGNVGLFKMLSSQSDIVEMMQSTHGELIFKATQSNQPKILEVISENQYLAGKDLEEDSGDQDDFISKFGDSFHEAVVAKNYNVLVVLSEKFPEHYLSPQDTEEGESEDNEATTQQLNEDSQVVKDMLELTCQFQNNTLIRKTLDPEKTAVGFTPSLCSNSHSLRDIANGYEKEQVNIESLQKQLDESVAKLIEPEKSQQGNFGNGHTSSSSNGKSNKSGIEKLVYDKTPTGYIMKVAPMLLDLALEVFYLYKPPHKAFDPLKLDETSYADWHLTKSNRHADCKFDTHQLKTDNGCKGMFIAAMKAVTELQYKTFISTFNPYQYAKIFGIAANIAGKFFAPDEHKVKSDTATCGFNLLVDGLMFLKFDGTNPEIKDVVYPSAIADIILCMTSGYLDQPVMVDEENPNSDHKESDELHFNDNVTASAPTTTATEI